MAVSVSTDGSATLTAGFRTTSVTNSPSTFGAFSLTPPVGGRLGAGRRS